MADIMQILNGFEGVASFGFSCSAAPPAPLDALAKSNVVSSICPRLRFPLFPKIMREDGRLNLLCFGGLERGIIKSETPLNLEAYDRVDFFEHRDGGAFVELNRLFPVG